MKNKICKSYRWYITKMTKLGKIYKIVHKQLDICYVGSTFEKTLERRWKNHNSYYNKWKVNHNNKRIAIYPYFYKYEIENFSILLIKEYKVVDRRHLSVYENLWIKKLRCVNIIEPVAGILGKHKMRLNHQANKEMRNKQKRENYKKNKETISIQRKKDRIENKEDTLQRESEYREKDRIRIRAGDKRRYHENKVVTRKKRNAYRDTNKIEINKKRAERDKAKSEEEKTEFKKKRNRQHACKQEIKAFLRIEFP